MKQIRAGLYRLSCSFIRHLSLIFTGLLFLTAFIFTCYAADMETQKVLTSLDNPLINIAGGLIFLALLYICCRLVCRHAVRNKRILLCMVFAWIGLAGVLMVLFSKTAPAADAWSVYSCAERLANGDTSVIHPTDSYLSYYPQQVGLMAFYELLIRLLKLFPLPYVYYHYFKLIYILLTYMIVFFQYRTVHLLWEDDRADCIYLILAGINLPLIMYSAFVYGEIPSFAFLSLGLYCLLKMLKKGEAFSLPLMIVSLTALTLSVMLRKNSLVVIIAVVLVALLEWCIRRRHSLLIFAVLCTVLSLSVLPSVQKFYEHRAGNYLRSGVPALSYFAMGMQEASRGNGWYNGFNFCTYQDTGMDTEATEELSRQAIAERLAYFRQHPGYACQFYLGKYLSQWADGTYASRQATLGNFGGRSAFFEELYDGRYSPAYIAYCNIYQLVVYLCAFVVFLHMFRRDCPSALYPYLMLIGAFGGFLFHMLWEANARYIFLYGQLLIPYAARGAAILYDVLPVSVSRAFSRLSDRRKGTPPSAGKDT